MQRPHSIQLPTGLKQGQHCLLDLYGCDAELLNSSHALETILHDAARHSGATVLGMLKHEFDPQGLSLVFLLAESHLSIHTWPEFGSATLDMYTCGDTCNPVAGCDYVIAKLHPSDYLLTQVNRSAPAALASARSHCVPNSQVPYCGHISATTRIATSALS